MLLIENIRKVNFAKHGTFTLSEFKLYIHALHFWRKLPKLDHGLRWNRASSSRTPPLKGHIHLGKGAGVGPGLA